MVGMPRRRAGGRVGRAMVGMPRSVRRSVPTLETQCECEPASVLLIALSVHTLVLQSAAQLATRLVMVIHQSERVSVCVVGLAERCVWWYLPPRVAVDCAHAARE